MRTLRFGALVLLGLVGCVPSAWAQTDEIQVYDAEIVSQGNWNLTWHNNYTPSGRLTPDFPGAVIPDHTLNGVPEWAYGLRDWLELGAYVPIYSLESGGRLLFDGVKLRTLFVVPHAAERPFFTVSTLNTATTARSGIRTASRVRSGRSSACISGTST